MEYVISNFTKIGIKDIQIIFIENIIEKSIYGIYCLVLYLIKKIIDKNDKYSQLRATTKQKKTDGPRKRDRDRDWDWAGVQEEEEDQPVHSWAYVSLCAFTIVYMGIYTLLHLY
jgi:hypothetical protein